MPSRRATTSSILPSYQGLDNKTWPKADGEVQEEGGASGVPVPQAQVLFGKE